MKRSKNNFCRRLGSRRYFLHKNQSRELYKKSHRASYKKLKNKRNLSADSCSLLLSALRPRLLNVRIFGTMPIRLSTLKVRKFGLLFAMPMAIITFMLMQNAEITKVSAVSLELTVPTNFSVNLSYGVNDGFGVSDVSQVSVKTGAFFGYTLSINAKDGNNLKNGANLLTPIAQEFASDEEFKTSGLANTWGYKPSKFNSADNTKFLPGPDQEAIIEKTEAANSDAANSYDLSIAAKIDATTVAGTYTNTFIFSATANTTKYKFTYNGGEEASQVPAEQSGDTVESTIKLDEGKPERENYEFLGWCDVETSDENCTGETYQPGDTYPKSGALKSNDNDVTFYAIWKSTGPKFLGHLGDMQSFSCSQIDEVESYGTVTDTRDNHIYNVAKLKDGKCWMIDDLEIGDENLGNRTLNSSNSDVGSNFAIPSSKLSGSFLRESHNVASYYHDPATGSYYSWRTATAGSGSWNMSHLSNASYSVCPKGWKLPTSGSSNNSDYYNLLNLYPSYEALTSKPIPNFTVHCSVVDSEISGCNSDSGVYWSSTAYNQVVGSGTTVYNNCALMVQYSSAWGIRADDGEFVHQNYGYKVRCIKR